MYATFKHTSRVLGRWRVVSSRSSKQASLRFSDSQADFQNKSNQKWPESGFEGIWL